MDLQLKQEIVDSVRANNMLMAELADANKSMVTAIELMIARKSQKLMQLKFLSIISRSLETPIESLTEEVEKSPASI